MHGRRIGQVRQVGACLPTAGGTTRLQQVVVDEGGAIAVARALLEIVGGEGAGGLVPGVPASAGVDPACGALVADVPGGARVLALAVDETCAPPRVHQGESAVDG